jgi:hypothetical protein
MKHHNLDLGCRTFGSTPSPFYPVSCKAACLMRASGPKIFCPVSKCGRKALSVNVQCSQLSCFMGPTQGQSLLELGKASLARMCDLMQ